MWKFLKRKVKKIIYICKKFIKILLVIILVRRIKVLSYDSLENWKKFKNKYLKKIIFKKFWNFLDKGFGRGYYINRLALDINEC